MASERKSPLSPTSQQAIGAPGTYPAGANYPGAGGSPNTMPVPKQSAKNAYGDPSLGTAVPRPASLERTGAAYKIRTQFNPQAVPVNAPGAQYFAVPHGAANTMWDPDKQGPSGVGDDAGYPEGTNAQVHGHIAQAREGDYPVLG